MRCTDVCSGPRLPRLGYRWGWRGLRPAVLGVVLLALVAPGTPRLAAQEKGGPKEPGLDTLPREVREALDWAARVYAQPLNGARWSEASRLGGTDHSLYQVRGRNGRGNKVEIEVTSAGRVIEVEEHGIPLSEVPGAVIEALKTRMPHLKPARVEAIYQARNARPVSYGFEGNGAAGRTIEVYISADGKTFLN